MGMSHSRGKFMEVVKLAKNKNRVGRSKVEIFNNYEEGAKALNKLKKVKKGKSYQHSKFKIKEVICY